MTPHGYRSSPRGAFELSMQAAVAPTSYRSARLSPLHNFDSMMKDKDKKMHSEFPFSKRPTKNFKYEQGSFPVEVIEEDKAEAENQVSIAANLFSSCLTNFGFLGL